MVEIFCNLHKHTLIIEESKMLNDGERKFLISEMEKLQDVPEFVEMLEIAKIGCDEELQDSFMGYIEPIATDEDLRKECTNEELKIIDSIYQKWLS